MVEEGDDNLFMLGSWEELDEMSHRLDEGVCQSAPSATSNPQGTATEEGDVEPGSGSPIGGSRGDSAGDFRVRSKRDTASNYKLGEFEQ